MKSFAHPLRLRLYELLEEHGPSTATQLSGHVGENTGSTSYHLRELAKHGMIEVAEGMGRGKEKYWRVTPGGFGYGSPDDASDSEALGAIQVLLRDLVRQRGAELERWLAEEADTPREWVEASGLARRSLRLTTEESIAMRDAVMEVIEPYRTLSDARGPDHPGTARVIVHFDVFPAGAR
ncbi:winged helix-turn-helix domain-containing protein [Nonomuraea sp. NPDC050790]|uniref:winged helix-turn-helix domain-containing protein n=1 Tax=Nonomuraea sp. NPDC050790 TaxID=3364371 RepID=UPI0037B9B2A7